MSDDSMNSSQSTGAQLNGNAQQEQAQQEQTQHEQTQLGLAQQGQALPEQTLFTLMGGESGWRALVDRFYDQMDLDERFAGIRKLHPNTLDGSRDKLYWFLCGWSGGPNHYIERFGHPRLRARHMPFPIATGERDQWLLCMAEAMQYQGLAPALFDRLLESFFGTADWMRNTQG